MKKTKVDLLVAATLMSIIAASWVQAFNAPVDRIQGEVYRIIFVHVPAAAAAFFSTFVLFIAAIVALVKKSERWLMVQKASVEVGLVFMVLTLITGSIWGRPTWGTWWTWDARLTTSLILAVMQASFLLLYASTEPGPSRINSCSILSLLITIDVPIIYKSVSWWRTLHQPAVMFTENQDRAMSPEIANPLTLSIFAVIGLASWLIYLRQENILLENKIEATAFSEMR